MAINFQKLGKRISTSRNRNGMSVKQLASKLGIESGSLANIESGNAAPSTDLLFAIANVLQVPADYLLADSLKNTSDAIDYMIYDLFVTTPSPNRNRLISMSKALLSSMTEDSPEE